MGAKIGGDDEEILADINVTPLVDIMLVLLIIFMLTTETISEKLKKPAIEVDLPTASSAENKPRQPLSVVINKDGDLFLNAEPITEAALRDAVAERARAETDPEAVLSADKRINHGLVVRVVDLIRLAGVKNVAINTKEQEIE
jgi:biopolymer transport protein ExbD